MKKKFIALLLVTLMLFSGVLTSCSDTVEFDEISGESVHTVYDCGGGHDAGGHPRNPSWRSTVWSFTGWDFS